MKLLVNSPADIRERMTETRLRKGDAAERLASELRRAVVSGEFQPGEPLRQEELAERFSSSRMPVREALRALDAEGLVRLVPNRGAIVAPIDAREFQENVEMREAAETLAMKLAIPHVSNALLDEAAMIQKDIEASGNADFGYLNKAFHCTLYRPCDRPRLLAHISGLHDIAGRYLTFTLSNLGYSSRSSDEHRLLLKACYDRDAERAVEILRTHIVGAGEALSSFLRDREG